MQRPTRAHLSMALMMAVLLGAGDARTVPEFSAYGVREEFTGSPAAVDLASHPDARRFRTVLREHAAAGPNFAGHYTIVTWGCGTDCKVLAVVNSRTGTVQIAPFLFYRDASFRRDSRLLVLESPESFRDDFFNVEDAERACSELPNHLTTTRYFEWKDDEFQHVQDADLCQLLR